MQPLVYTKMLDYSEFIYTNGHADSNDIASAECQELWVRQGNPRQPALSECWLCCGHHYTLVTVNS